MNDTIPTPGSQSRCLEGLIQEYFRTRDPHARERIILDCQPMVCFLAKRFQNGSEPLEDLIQVGNIGLINALDRFAPNRGFQFSSYAYPSILGELKRYFRDKARPLKAPRAVSELHLRARSAADDLTALWGRSPTVPELAHRLGVTEEALLEAMEFGHALYPCSLDAPTDSDETSVAAVDMLGAEDGALQNLFGDGHLYEALESLRPREREVVQLRFVEALTQAKTAERLGISQMQVSRLQRQALDHLREKLACTRRGGAATPSLRITASAS